MPIRVISDSLYRAMHEALIAQAGAQGFDLVPGDTPDHVPHMIRWVIGESIMRAKLLFDAATESTTNGVEWADDMLSTLAAQGLVLRKRADIPPDSLMASLDRGAAYRAAFLAQQAALTPPAAAP